MATFKDWPRVFESAPGIVILFQGPNHRVRFVNRAGRLAARDDDLVGKPIRDVLTVREGDALVDALDRVYRTGEGETLRQVPVRLREGPGTPPALTLDAALEALLNERRQPEGVILQAQDFSELLRFERQVLRVTNELTHRVKNTLAVIGALAAQTLRKSGRDSVIATFQDRLAAYARAHDILVASPSGSGMLRDTIESALIARKKIRSRIELRGPDVEIGPKQTLSLALAIHELLTNAMRYGALSTRTGRVEVEWFVDAEEGSFALQWRECDGPEVRKPRTSGLGNRLVKNMLSVDFEAEVDLQYDPAGFSMRVNAPLSGLSDASPRIGFGL